MEKNNHKRDILLYVATILFFYLLQTLIIYFIAKQYGTDGETIQLFGGGDDGAEYWQQIKNNFMYGNVSYINATKTWYVPLMSFLVQLAGVASPLIVRIANIIALTCMVVGILKIIGLIENELSTELFNVKKKMMLVIFFYPSLIYLLFSIYRDYWIYMFMVWSVFFGAKWVVSNSVFSFIQFVICTFFLYHFRGYAAAAVLLAIFISKIIINKSSKSIRNIMYIGLFLFFIWYTFFINFNVPYLDLSLLNAIKYRDGMYLSGDQYVLLRSGASDFGVPFSANFFPLFIVQYVYSVLVNFAGPFFWQIKSMGTLIGFVESIFIVTVMINYFKIEKWKRQKVLSESKVLRILLIQSIVWFGAIGLTNKNLGTAIRLRVPGILFVLIIVFTVAYVARKKFSDEKKYNMKKYFD
ncbi:MAG: hypothetical protein ACRCV1_09965 [Leuconostoc mesenteroides]